MNIPSTRQDITGLILAGGRGQRAGGRDKGLIQWQGRALVEHVVARLRPQVHTLLLSCNRNRAEYAELVPEPLADLRPDYQGPLAGVEAARDHVNSRYLLLAPCDAPELPADLAQRLVEALEADSEDSHDIAVPWDGEREQYLCALLKRSSLESLTAFLDSGERAVRAWYESRGYLRVDFSDCRDNFRNINRPQ